MEPRQVDIKKLNENITLVVSLKETREFKVRMRLAKCFWALGAKIAGCGIKFDGADDSIKW